MANQKVAIDITTNIGQAEQGLRTIKRSLDDVGKQAKDIVSPINALKGAISVLGIGYMIKDVLEAALQMESLTRQFTVFTGSAALAAKEIQFVRDQSNRLGLDTIALTSSYALFLNAVKGTANEGQKARSAFVGISEGMAAVGMTADMQSRAWTQLNQGIMKGKFELEDLKTITEAGLPIFKLMADALGITTAEFMKQQKEGKILANEVLPLLGESMHHAYGVAALEGAKSAQGQINLMNNAMRESKAVAGEALMPTFTSLVTNVFTPMVKLIGLIVKGLQDMAAAAAFAANQLMDGIGGFFTGKMFTKSGYDELMEKSLENERIYKEQRDKIWAGPSSTDYSAADAAGRKGAGTVPPKDTRTAAQISAAQSLAAQWRTTYADIRTEIENTNPLVDKHAQAINKVNNRFEDLAQKKGADKSLLAALRTELVNNMNARKAETDAVEAAAAATKRDGDAKQALLEISRLQLREDKAIAHEMERQAQQAAETADINNRNRTDAAQLRADQSQNGLFGNGSTAFSAIDDQLAADKLAIEERYSAEQMAIQGKIDLLQQSRDFEMEQIDSLHQARMAAIEAENKAKFFDQPQQLAAAAAAGTAAEKAYQDKISGIKASAASQNTALIGALNKALTLSAGKEAQEQVTAEQKASRAKMQAVAGYASFGAEAFSLLAETQDQSSRSGFESAKAFNLAAAVMSTAAAVMNAFATVPWPGSMAAAALAAATGVIQIANIASTSFEGGGSVSAPSGSFAGSGGASGSDTGLGNLPQQVSSIQDSRTNESIDRLTASTDNSAVVIGKLSKSIDSLTDLFQSGGAGYSLANNAPGRFTGTSEIATTMGTLMDIGKGYVNAVAGLFTLNFSKMMDGISGFVGGVKSAVFGGSWQTTGAGISLGVNSGNVTGQTYTTSKKDGGWFGSDKTSTAYTANSDLQTYAAGLIAPFISDLTNMARTLGTSLDTSGFTMKATDIATAGRTTEDIAADVQKWMLTTLQGMSLTIKGLDGATGSYDDVYETLKLLNDALVTTNDAFALVGKTTLQGSIDNAKWAVSLQALMGGTEEFTTKMDDYFSVMYTDAEQSAMKAAAAGKDVNASFAEMNQVLLDSNRNINGNKVVYKTVDGFEALALAVPKTIEEFNNLRNSLNVTTEEGAQLFAALTEIGPAFAEMTKYAEEFAKAQLDLNQSAQSRILSAQGKTDEAAIFDQQISQAAELLSAKESLLNTTQLEIAQSLERDALIKQQSDAKSAALAAEISKTLGLNLAYETLAGNTAEVTRLTNLQREASIVGWSDSDAAIQRNTWALQDQKTAADAATSATTSAAAAAKTYADNLASAHDRLVVTAMSAVDNAHKTLQNSVDEEKKIAQMTYDYEKKIADERVASLTESTGKLTSLSESLKSATDAINPMTWGAAQEQINGAIAAARGGVFADSTSLQTAISALGNKDTSTYATATDYARAQQVAANSMNELKKLTDGQLTIEEQSLKVAEASVKSLDDGFAKQNDYLDGILLAAQLQIDALNNINNTITSVTAAQAAMAPAVSGAQAAVTAQKVAVWNESTYLSKNSDVADALAGKGIYGSSWGPGTGMTALDHWNQFGKAEGRSFAVGTNYVPYDMTANIHEGERIIPKADNYELMQRLGSNSNNAELVAKLEAVLTELKKQGEERKAEGIAVAKNTSETTRLVRRLDPDGDGVLEVRSVA